MTAEKETDYFDAGMNTRGGYALLSSTNEACLSHPISQGKKTHAPVRRLFTPLTAIILTLCLGTSYLWFGRPTSSLFRPSFDLSEADLLSSNLNVASFENKDRDFSGLAITEMCEQVQWVEGRYMQCPGLVGGLSNVRNLFLNCVRFSIESGSAFVMPEIFRRGALTDPATNLRTGGMMGMEARFDKEHFTEALRIFCPQMKVLDSPLDIPSYANLTMIPSNYGHITEDPACGQLPWVGGAFTRVASFRPLLDSFLQGALPENDYAHPLLLQFGVLFYQYPVRSDPDKFWKQFGLILRPHPDAFRIATEIYSKIIEQDSDYIGVHLRVEDDIGDAWGTFEAQAALIASAIDSHQTSRVVYVACGDLDDIARFAEYYQEHGTRNVTVLSKSALLSPQSLQFTLAMDFDKQAGIDYLLMLKSGFFVGNGASSFAEQIAVRRNLFSTMSEDSFLEVGNDEYTMMWNGPAHNFFRRTMWP